MALSAVEAPDGGDFLYFSSSSFISLVSFRFMHYLVF